MGAQELNALFVSAMPTWIYNGFTEDSDGEPVQGSDVSPLRMTFGLGAHIGLGPRHRLEPQLWLYLQEYAALHAYDKTVPTQIETGPVVGDVVNTLGLAVALPWMYVIPLEHVGEDTVHSWDISVGGGLAAIFRIPLNGIDGSDTDGVGEYWIERILYPFITTAVDYHLTDRVQIGGGAEWYLPVYNAWVDSEKAVPFLDETMVRLGLRLRYQLSR